MKLKFYFTKVFGFIRSNMKARIKLLKKMPTDAVCAEIGVWKGDFSDLILQVTSPRKLHLIDPWQFQGQFSDRMYGGAVAKNQQDMDAIFDTVKRRFENCQNVVFNKGKSEEVLQDFPDAYFDWVYIDGNHNYEFVMKDLMICFSKVKQGGFITGDDYTWGEVDGFPVKRAVRDFTTAKGLQGNLEVIGSQYLIRV